MAFRHLTLDRRRDISSRHTRRVHKCKCGREIRGNAFANHAAACPAYQEWKAEFDAAMARRRATEGR